MEETAMETVDATDRESHGSADETLPTLQVSCLEDVQQILQRCEKLGVTVSQPLFPPKSTAESTRQKIRLKGKAGADISAFCDGSSEAKPKRNGEYEVESILDMRVKEGQMYYYVKWKGWSSETNTWEPRANLLHCARKLQHFHEQFVGIKLNDKIKKHKCVLAKHGHSNHVKSSKKKPSKPKNGFAKVNYRSLIKKWNLNRNRELTKDELSVFMSIKMSHVHNKKRREFVASLKEWEQQINSLISEEVHISVENNVDTEGPPLNFTYINDYKPCNGIVIPDDPMVGCECVPNCYANRDKCCAHQSGGQFAYSPHGRVRMPKGSPIYECNRRCSCGIGCQNRVVQHGRTVKLSIFRTSNGRGWGVKTLQRIGKGCFVMEYVGEVITNEEAEKRGKVYDAEGRTYLFDLDYDDGDCLFTVDAAHYGNVSHFMNHSCEPNLDVYGVWINNLDPRLPRIAFFANKDIRRGEELTFDYLMTGDTTMADRTNNQTETGAGADNDCKRIPCKCGSKKCRKYLF